MACAYLTYSLTRKEATVTRESKLALIIGFVLVLVVGVLVSDHFSQANSMSLDSQDPEVARVIVPLTDLGQHEERRLDSAFDQAMDDRQHTLVRLGQSTSPVIISNSSRDATTKAQVTNAKNNSANSILDRAMEHVQDLELPRAAQIASRPMLTNPRPLPEGRFRKYKVVKGDTLIAIARQILGDEKRWAEIHRLNADVLGPDAILKIGMDIKLPYDAKAGDAQSNTTRRSLPSKRTYTVVSGDTLGEISMKLLGTSKRAAEIAKLNGLESANNIRIGMSLKIPAK